MFYDEMQKVNSWHLKCKMYIDIHLEKTLTT